jgi:N-acetylglucosamine-6-phosphate deacetylase
MATASERDLDPDPDLDRQTPVRNRAPQHSPRAARGAPSTVLSGARVVLPTGIVDGGRVVVEGTRIADGTHGVAEDAEVIDLTGHWLVPGFVDVHNHGGGGASFTSGSADEILQGIHTHRVHGTTTLVASTVTVDMDFLAQRAGLLSELAEQGEIAGIHFEGPFISPCRKGAHSEALLRHPEPADVRKLIDAARGQARMVTLATELPGGIDSVRLLAEHGVIAAIGHTDATYEQTVEAIDAGTTLVSVTQCSSSGSVPSVWPRSWPRATRGSRRSLQPTFTTAG